MSKDFVDVLNKLSKVLGELKRDDLMLEIEELMHDKEFAIACCQNILRDENSDSLTIKKIIKEYGN